MQTVEHNPKKDWNPKTAYILYGGAKRDNGKKGAEEWDLEKRARKGRGDSERKMEELNRSETESERNLGSCMKK